MNGLTASELAYWSAVSQIGPVLGLALVIELRQVGRRWARKKSKASYETRRFVVGLAVVTGVGLVWSQSTALLVLMSEVSADWFYWTSYVSIALALAFVVGTPLEALRSAALADRPTNRRLVRRLRRSRARTRGRFDVLMRRITTDWLVAEQMKLEVLSVQNELFFSADHESPEARALGSRASKALETIDERLLQLRQARSDMTAISLDLDSDDRMVDGLDSPAREETRARVMRRLLAAEAAA